ncbi:nucleotide exchange factor GrpE [Pleomorphomonas koreensis]|uniref:nucleotide exchange factor GrpE n=1 Tax=Pleomorphomonas koreensis TaxID=257440 RepID=UPI000421C8AC|nr:nucleotide exchange factor GrpE [Pleomorphomonas koreensis]
MADETAQGPTTPELDPVVDQGLQRIAALEKEAADLKDQLLRTLADMENLRRRTEREIADARTYAVTNFARDMVGAADNLTRAIAAVDAEARASGDAALIALVEGVELTERELMKALEKHGISRVDPAGEKFDPNFHQAMFEVPDPSVPAGTVVQVMQVGFKIGERVLRPALVGVGRGGPKAAPADESAQPDKPADGGHKIDKTV